MGLNEDERTILVGLELEKAFKLFDEAENIASLKLWDAVANRLFYAAFHAVSALLIKSGHEIGTHKGTVITFGRYFVKTGLVTKEDGRLYSQLQTLRESGDYNCHIETTEEDIFPKISAVKHFLTRISELVSKM